MMRQFVLGLIVAALAWWAYGGWIAGAESQGATGATGNQLPVTIPNASRASDPSVGGPGDNLEQLLARGSVPAANDSAGAAGGPAGASATGTSATGDEIPAAVTDWSKLMGLVAAGNADAISRAWSAVATGQAGREADRVVAALAPRGDTFADHLRALGRDNSFLHSHAGREAAQRAVKAAMALPDADALTAGSQLVYLMTRGRINRTDNQVRAAVDEAMRQHRIRVDRWLCNPTNVAGARSYTVQAGNSLDVIARKFRRQGLKVESGTIAVLNRISNPNALRVGQQLKVPVAPITAVLEKRSYALMVFVGDQLLRLYWVGHGEHDRTPVTEFSVIAKQAQPDWTAPDGNRYPYGHPKNILGEFFIKFGHPQYAGFGAHGTPMPETICTMSSMGCIRMFAPDIAELFRILPRGAQVIVRATESLR